MRRVLLSDTTLRDGEQMAGASLMSEDKAAIARALVEAGVDSIEGGFPGAARCEIEAIQRIVRELPAAVVSALARTVESDIDAAAEALQGAPRFRRVVNLFIGTSPLHRDHKLRKSKTELLGVAKHGVEYARRYFDWVTFSAEDASRTEPDFLNEVYSEAIDSGANVIAFPDTLGVLTPEGVKKAIGSILSGVPNAGKARLAVHFHDDLGLAVANTLAGIEAGAAIVQCTVNGIGERAGNAALEEVALALALNLAQYNCHLKIRLEKLASLSRLVAERTGIPVAPNKAVVGANVFVTEAGIHQDGILKEPQTYVPFPPELVGASGVRLALGKHSGRSAVAAQLAQLGLPASRELVENVLDSIKTGPKQLWDEEKLRLLATAAIKE